MTRMVVNWRHFCPLQCRIFRRLIVNVYSRVWFFRYVGVHTHVFSYVLIPYVCKYTSSGTFSARSFFFCSHHKHSYHQICSGNHSTNLSFIPKHVRLNSAAQSAPATPQLRKTSSWQAFIRIHAPEFNNPMPIISLHTYKSGEMLPSNQVRDDNNLSTVVMV